MNSRNPLQQCTSKETNVRSQFTVLVVDDDQAIRNLISEVLGNAGWKVLAVESAAQAIKLAEEGIPDVLISDVYMPDITSSSRFLFVAAIIRVLAIEMV